MQLFLKFISACVGITFVFCLVPAVAGDVTVSSGFGTVVNTEQRRIGAGSIEILPLGNFEAGTQYSIQISSDNRVYPDVSAFVVDRDNLDAFRRSEQFSGVGFSKRVAPYQVTGRATSNQDYYLIIDNRYSLVVTKIVTAKIQVLKQLSDGNRNAIKSRIELLMQQALKDYDIPDFDVTVRPCGEINAMSAVRNGRITLCTEMMAATFNKPGAFLGIFFHEIGHTALNLWRLPNASNEETVDEFAVQLLVRANNGERLVREFAEYFSSGQQPCER